MYRQRLRPTPTADELAAMYAQPYDHLAWGAGHDLRVRQTITLAQAVVDEFGSDPVRAADLSCGDGAVLDGLRWPGGAYEVCRGDLTPGWEHHGPIETTLDEIPHVDLFICSETIEHVDDPDLLLLLLRAKADRLILSTPIAEQAPVPPNEGNREHLWGFDQEAVGLMLNEAGWSTVARVDLIIPNEGYSYQIWSCA